MSLKITDDNLNELDDFLLSRQNTSTEWFVVVHSENYVEIDKVGGQIKIPHSSDVIYELWEQGLQRFINQGDSIYLASESVREFSKIVKFDWTVIRGDWRLGNREVVLNIMQYLHSIAFIFMETFGTLSFMRID